MYLKSIEVQGFKSFANKIKFEFHNGITGIVGPNGSGKSNVADAVRWVLGEQKVKSLRGSKMEDVIFAGTENRKPLGFAFVAITLDNSDHVLPVDYQEVTVSRRLFRSGESEYMINGSNCRLKDINELFYDTGIGKEGYSIIGQGQIDKILSGKPDERRELFDEAAGIVKFKRRKLEALKKLDNENQNLVRVEDILSELEDRVGPLEKQAATAKEYLRLRDELKTADVNSFLVNHEHLKKQLSDTEEKIEIATSDMADTKSTFENTKKEYEKLDAFIEELNQNVDNKKNELNETILYKEKLDGQIQVLNEQINSARSNDQFLNERIDSISKNIDEHMAKKEELKQNKVEIEEAIRNAADAQNDVDSLLAQTNDKVNELNEKCEEYKAEIIEILNQKSLVKSKIERYDTLLEQIGMRRDELDKRINQFNNDKDAQQKAIDELTKEKANVDTQISDAKDKERELSDVITKIRQENTSISNELEKSQMEFHKQSSRLETLKNLTERYDGYGNSIRKIMELKSSNKGIIGVVADIIKVDKKYETAIETALGGSIQNVVTDTETTAKELIRILKENKFGRATFLPLSSMSKKTGFSNERALEENGVIGLACDLVNIKEEYQGISRYLLGRTVVVDTIDNAIRIARKYSYTLRMVTLEGEQLNPGGSMSGGAFRNSSNLLGRRREIADIEKALVDITSKRDSQTKQLNANKTKILGANEELEKVKSILQQTYLLQNTIKMNLSQAGSKRDEIEESFKNFTRETAQIGEQLKDINQNSETLNNELKGKEDRNAELEKLISDINGEIDKLNQQVATRAKEAEDKRVSINDLKGKHNFTVTNIKRLDDEVDELKAELDEITSNSADSADTIDSRTKAIEGIRKELEETQAKIEAINAELTELAASKEEQMRDHKDFFHKRESLNDKINELEREIFRLNASKEKYEESDENIVDYMWTEYELTYGAALEFREENLPSLTELRKQVNSLKSQIRALGPVNVNAIEDYKNVGERYEFLRGQHNDLTEAKNNLLKIVEELDTGMRNQFNEKFADIQIEFDKVFKEMFGGGKGEIQIEEGDVLEAGITIISQPPGKKLQNMMQMSGGEKALTAIALLFAIQNLKPSPFCLLDEIEAALDGSNVVRFAEYLHKLTENTQFIVITHRRGTMNCVDRLYGITMQEKGVSTLVSVNLLESELSDEPDELPDNDVSDDEESENAIEAALAEDTDEE